MTVLILRVARQLAQTPHYIPLYSAVRALTPRRCAVGRATHSETPFLSFPPLSKQRREGGHRNPRPYAELGVEASWEDGDSEPASTISGCALASAAVAASVTTFRPASAEAAAARPAS